MEFRRYGGITPCHGVCMYDKNDQFCVGCYRTKEEIERWSQMTAEQQKNIIMDLKKRRIEWKNRKT